MAVVRRLGAVQIDSVNVLTRAHYLPLFSRLGAYPRGRLDALVWGERPALFEYWAHEASLAPVETHPLLRWRMRRAAAGEGVWGRMAPFAGPLRPKAEALCDRIRLEGPKTAAELTTDRGAGGWWGWSETKTALEWLFYAGRLAARTRRGNFERVYDLAERVLPAEILEAPALPDADAQRQLVLIAARALGVAAYEDLKDYFRLPAAEARARIEELLEAGDLQRVRIEGSPLSWVSPRSLEPARPIVHQALLAPFDPLIWARDRAERLFSVRYRLEIYTPAHKRTHGYYVLPFLLDEAIVARVDLKADRKAGRLLVKGAHTEPGAPRRTPGRLADALQRLAAWQDLDGVTVEANGPLADSLTKALGAGSPRRPNPSSDP